MRYSSVKFLENGIDVFVVKTSVHAKLKFGSRRHGRQRRLRVCVMQKVLRFGTGRLADYPPLVNVVDICPQDGQQEARDKCGRWKRTKQQEREGNHQQDS